MSAGSCACLSLLSLSVLVYVLMCVPYMSYVHGEVVAECKARRGSDCDSGSGLRETMGERSAPPSGSMRSHGRDRSEGHRLSHANQPEPSPARR